MKFIRDNLLVVLALLLYIIWWFYILFDFSKTEYDNHYAGAMAVDLIVSVTAFLLITYSIAFLLAAFITKKWKKYLFFNLIILIPILVVYIINVCFD